MNKALKFLALIMSLTAVTACAMPGMSATATMPPGDWDYVVLGDSTTLGFPELLKEGIEADYNGEVTITIENWYMGEQTSSQMLRALLTTEPLREDIRNAELITIMIPFGGMSGALQMYENGGACGGEDNQDCLRESLAKYKSDTQAIFAELVNLHSPSDALIRTQDLWQFYSSKSQEMGIFEVVNSYWLEANAAVHAAAESYGIPVVNAYDAFMGEDGIQPPEENGLVVMDMIHTTQEGRQLLADLYRDLGYELTMP